MTDETRRCARLATGTVLAFAGSGRRRSTVTGWMMAEPLDDPRIA